MKPELEVDRVGAVPALSCADARTFEGALLQGDAAEWAAMQRAGAAVAAAIRNDFAEIGGVPASVQILTLVGKGHNGGDALLATLELLRVHAHATAEVVFCFGEPALRPLARRAWTELQAGAAGRVNVRTVAEVVASSEAYALVLDGIFGFQFRPPMDPEVATLLGRINTRTGIRFRAAVDLPSGVGAVSDSVRFRADFTYATGIVKLPALVEDVAASVGRLRFLDLGFFEKAIPSPGVGASAGTGQATRILTAATLAPLSALRPAQTDKRSYGHVLVVGGSRSYPGAVMLATRAALHSGVGLVTAFVPAALAPEFAAAQPEAMWVGCPETRDGGLGYAAAGQIAERAERATAMVIGPGLGATPRVLATVREILARVDLPVVLDADALRPEMVAAVRERHFVCTPHAGEFKRIAPVLYDGDRFTAPAGVLVLKGARTRITHDSSTQYLSLAGGPVLARGGSGDMLAGLIGGLLAQTPDDPLLAACRGVAWHGRAADLLARSRGQVAVEVSELIQHLGPALLE